MISYDGVRFWLHFHAFPRNFIIFPHTLLTVMKSCFRVRFREKVIAFSPFPQYLKICHCHATRCKVYHICFHRESKFITKTALNWRHDERKSNIQKGCQSNKSIFQLETNPSLFSRVHRILPDFITRTFPFIFYVMHLRWLQICAQATRL